jgi:nucleoid-associated protein YgaU
MKKFIIHGLKEINDAPGSAGSFKLQINPESIKRNRALTVKNGDAGDTSSAVKQYDSYGDETLDLDFFLDATGVLEGSPAFVDDLIKELTDTIYHYEGDKHKPNYLFIEYGSFSFKSMMTAFNVEYTLFDKNGMGLRAKVHLALTHFKELGEQKSSPDMSHSFTIREGDSLPLLSKQVYGKMDYYLQVAEHNGLTNFRDLEVGSVIEFPPLQR